MQPSSPLIWIPYDGHIIPLVFQWASKDSEFRAHIRIYFRTEMEFGRGLLTMFKILVRSVFDRCFAVCWFCSKELNALVRF